MNTRHAPWGALAVFALLAGATTVHAQPSLARTESFHYGVEWRFVRAGEVEFHVAADRQVEMKLRSVGLVSTLFKVDDIYRALFDPGNCLTNIELRAYEGRRQRETKVAVDRAHRRLNYLEKDIPRGNTVLARELDVPACVFDVTGGLGHLRRLNFQPGGSAEIPVTDGKKVVMARVEAQGREQIRTPVGEFRTMRYEAHLFNGVLYARKGRLFIWISDDERRLPVQIKVQLPFYIGTLTLTLEKVQ
jgi:hypothetical protein